MMVIMIDFLICNFLARVFAMGYSVFVFLCFSRIKMAMFWPHGNTGPFQLRAEKGTCRPWICHVLPPQLLYFLLHRISVPAFFCICQEWLLQFALSTLSSSSTSSPVS